MDKIFVGNKQQQILLECELKGQLSDGAWENAVPHNHWQRPCAAEVVIASGEQDTGLTWHHRKKYGFARKDLLEVVSDRMVYFVKFYTAFPVLANSFDDHWDYDMSDGWPEGKDKYWSDKRAKFLKKTGCGSWAEAKPKIDAVDYTSSDLRSDLRALNELFKRTV